MCFSFNEWRSRRSALSLGVRSWWWQNHLSEAPNSEVAAIPAEKLKDYLLSPSHPIGRFKSSFVRALGYEANEHGILEAGIRSLLVGSAEETEKTEFGTKYLVRGTVVGPSGRSGEIVTVWIILIDKDVRRFVTAYPEG